MSDSEDSTVTYTVVSSQFRGLSDIGSLEFDGLPMMLKDPYVEATLQAPPSPNYVPGPEHPPSLQFVLEPVYPEFMPPEDEVFPAEEQPLPVAVSPTAESPGYIADYDPEEDPKEDPTNYSADGGDDDDDDDDESSDDDEDDDDDVEEDEDEDEEEHPAPTNSVPPLIARLLAIPSPPPSPLSPLSSPLPQIPSPPLPVSSPVHVSPLPLPTSPTYPLGYRVAMIWLRAETPSTSIEYTTIRDTTTPTYTITYSITTFAFTSTSRRADVPEVTLPPRKRADYGFVATLDDEIRRDPEREVGYRITDTWDEMLVGMPGAPATDDTELGRRMTDFVTTIRHDMDEIYRRLDDAQDDRLLMSGRLNMLFRDRRAHAHTALLMEREARLSRGSTAGEITGWGSRHTEGTAYENIDTDEDTADIGDNTP
ncbi:hypothetical protein Tco_0357171 [Tanacetum coccineum]